ncbi:MAG: NAD-dependent epimerase/dehydratase family protein [Luteitalea sp.]|nr:NAD-dependent epimerase/dehydratase family protein [Luteitalea sp.]
MKVFVIGATGYIGGAVAQGLVGDGHQVLGMARSEQKAAQLQARGIQPVLATLYDRRVIEKTAASADAVVSAADSDNAYTVTALLGALRDSGKWLIHTSGSSIVGDRAEGHASDAIYDEESRPAPRLEKRARVAIDEAVLGAASDGVRSVVICPTMVYGVGQGLHEHSVQVPMLARLTREYGAGVHIGPGKNRWSNVHIEDLVNLYRISLTEVPGGTFLFGANGEAALRDIAAAISRRLGFQGRTVGISAEEGIHRVGAEASEFALASNSRVRAVAARALGWRPRHDDLLEGIDSGAYPV